MINFNLPTEYQEMQELYRKFAEERVKPLAREMDEKEAYDLGLLKEMQEIGILGIPFEEKYGGQGGDVLSYALCMEELAADFVAHTMQSNGKEAERTIMDIKLFSDEDSLRMIIRNAAKRYNPLQFELDDQTFGKVGVKLAQKVAREIDYSYVYRMNIVTILLDK